MEFKKEGASMHNLFGIPDCRYEQIETQWAEIVGSYAGQFADITLARSRSKIERNKPVHLQLAPIFSEILTKVYAIMENEEERLFIMYIAGAKFQDIREAICSPMTLLLGAVGEIFK